jgi:hypothetical protein
MLAGGSDSPCLLGFMLELLQLVSFCANQWRGFAIRYFFDPGIRDGKKFGSGIRDEHPRSFFESLETGFWLKILSRGSMELGPWGHKEGKDSERFQKCL